MKTGKNNLKCGFICEFSVCVLFIATLFALILCLTHNTNPFANYYNSYSLQAERWLSGHLDLGQDYSHLEIAKYDGKFYISFPPFPTVVLLPFVLVSGVQTPDSIISIIFSIISAFFALKIAHRFDIYGKRAVFWTLFLIAGSNLLSIMTFGWVWFMAQTMCFAFLLTSIYFMLSEKTSLCFLFWSFAVGCRPLCAVYFPFFIYYFIKSGKNIKTLVFSLLPAAFIALFYMVLNHARFGNPLEFGHNYLPEFLEAEQGQFSVCYMMQNIKNLFRIPFSKEAFQSIKFNGFAFYLVSPIYIAYAVLFAKSKKEPCSLLLLSLIILNLLLLTMHKTMGGWHFGNRYTVDALPFVYLGCMMSYKKGYEKLFIPLAVFGFVLNLLGTVWVFN
ncbi:MAG: hypothetical protein J5590_01405 [Clostridia bacterium]|nr:hypothetical protein [Clostridia bacterium]